MKKRLKSTKNIFNNRNATILTLVSKTQLNIERDYHRLNRLRGDLLRSKRPATIAKISVKLQAVAEEMALNPSTTVDKEKLLKRIEQYKRQNSFILYAAVQQAIIGLCANYEDFIQRVIVKYFEEDISRLSNNKHSFTSKFILDAVVRGDNIHHTLSEKAARELMNGGVSEWHKCLKERLCMDTAIVPHGVKEVFLIRNCLVHNNRRVSSELHSKNPNKYLLRRALRLDVQDVDNCKISLHQSMKHIVEEYNRLYPIPGGTWVGKESSID